MDATTLPGSLLIATQDDNGYGWNHQVTFLSNKVVIELRKEDALFLHGDFIHARAGYRWKNLCVHTYLGRVYCRPEFQGQLIPLYEDKPSADMFDHYVGRTARVLSKHLSTRHNFVTQSPRMREAAAHSRHAKSGSMSLVEIRNALAITITISPENDDAVSIWSAVDRPPLSSSEDHITTAMDNDMEMDILIATDSGSETETECSSPPRPMTVRSEQWLYKQLGLKSRIPVPLKSVATL